jgi:hypothetical protein
VRAETGELHIGAKARRIADRVEQNSRGGP